MGACAVITERCRAMLILRDRESVSDRSHVTKKTPMHMALVSGVAHVLRKSIVSFFLTHALVFRSLVRARDIFIREYGEGDRDAQLAKE